MVVTVEMAETVEMVVMEMLRKKNALEEVVTVELEVLVEMAETQGSATIFIHPSAKALESEIKIVSNIGYGGNAGVGGAGGEPGDPDDGQDSEREGEAGRNGIAGRDGEPRNPQSLEANAVSNRS